MAFKVKDLMVNVLPSDKPGGGPCAHFSLVASPETTDELLQLASSASTALSKLQKQLKLYLELEKMRGATEKTSLPQTTREIDAVTKKLDGALKVLKVRRTELSKKPRPAKRK